MSNEHLTVVANHRGVQPPTLFRSIRGDLDWIAMKTLEKDRTRRYETAYGLALDVGRFLANETVLARPASPLYRFRKTVERNKLLFTGLSTAGMLLIAGLIVISVALDRERRSRQAAESAQRSADQARDRAQQEQAHALSQAEKSRQVTSFLSDILRGVGPKVAQGRDTSVLREVLEKGSTRIESELHDQPEIRSELLATIGTIYRDMMLWPEAAKAYRLALAAYTQEHREESDEAATSMLWLGTALHTLRQPEESEKMLREALRIKVAHHGEEHIDVALVMNNLGVVLYFGKDDPAGEAFIRKALAIREKLLPAGHIDIAGSCYYLGNILGYRDHQLAETERLYQRALDGWIRDRGPTGFNIDVMFAALAKVQRDQARLSQAETNFLRSLEISRKMLDPKHPIIPNTMFGLAVTQLHQGRLMESERTLREFLKFGGPAEGTRHDFLVLEGYGYLFQILAAQNDWAAAEALARDERAFAAKLRGPEHQQAAGALGRLAGALLTNGRGDEADQLFDASLTPELLAKTNGGYFLRERAGYRARQGRWRDALADAQGSVERLPAQSEGYHIVAALLVQQRDVEGYRALTRRLVERYGQTDTAVTAMRLAMDCLVLPPEKEPLDTIARWVDLGIQGETEGNWTSYAQCGRALLEYRRGNFAEALKSAEHARTSLRPDVRAMAGAVEVMAHWRQGDAPAARAAWAKHEAFANQPADTGNLGPEWKEWIHADIGTEWKGWIYSHTLLAEAAVLIGRH
jgi:tetratricopeptide (TPR) repeat protein